MKKKLVVVMLMMAFVLSQPLQAFAASIKLSDLEGHWAKEEIEFMVEQGAITGYPDGTFRPDNLISRSEFSKIQAELMNATSTQSAFAELKGHWAEKEINGLAARGVIDPREYPNGFQPNDPITRLEMSRMVARGLAEESLLWKGVLTAFKALKGFNLPFTDQSEMSMADLPYIALANGAGIIKGFQDGTFRMERSATRAEAAVMLKRYLDAKNKKPVLEELLEKFKGEPSIHNYTKQEMEEWIDREADFERLKEHPIVHNLGLSFSRANELLVRKKSRANEIYNAATHWMDVYFNRDYRTIGEEWIKDLRSNIKSSINYNGKQYEVEDLPELFDLTVQETKDEKRISESIFVTDLSLVYEQQRDPIYGIEYMVRGTQYIRYTSGTNLPEGIELNKWYKRDIDVEVMYMSGTKRVPWEVGNYIYKTIHEITPFEEVKN